LVDKYDLYLKNCFACRHGRLIRWGYYKRYALPSDDLIRIQRVRCVNCGRTTNVLPSFLLARKSYAVGALKELVMTFIDHPADWKQSPDLLVDLSTAYRWLRVLRKQAVQTLPDIRKELLKLRPHHRLLPPKTELLPDQETVVKRFIALGKQLFKAAARLADKKDDSQRELFCFLNYFLATSSGKPLLAL